MVYEIQFVRFAEGETWPAILQKMEIESPILSRVEEQAHLIYRATAVANPANGWQVIENGGAVVSQWQDPDRQG